MKKRIKQVLSVLLVLVMAFSCTAVAFAQPEPETGSRTQSDFVGTTGALSTVVAAMSDEERESSYCIAYLSVTGKTVEVKFNNTSACTLVVAIFAENGGEMLGTGVKQVEADAGSAQVELNVVSMPEHFVTKAFLLDGENKALCKNYESMENTKAFEEFLEKEPGDYADDTVLVFDDEKEVEDFAVLTDDVKSADSMGSMTFTFDEETGTYVFKNAIPQIKALHVGDMFYCDVDTETYLLFKVKTITVSGSTVTIAQDTDVGLDELFSFVRIDTEGDYDKMDPLTEDNLGSALSLYDEVAAQAEIDESGSNTWSTELKIKFPQKELKEDEKPPVFAFTASGSLKLSVATSVSLYYDVVLFGRDYYEFKHEFSFKATLSGTVSGGFDLSPYLTVEIPAIPIGATGLKLKVEPGLVFKGSIAVTFKVIEYSYKVTTTADPDNGLHKNEEKNHDVDMDLDDKFEITFGVHLDIKLNWKKDLLSLKLAGQVGVKLSGSKLGVGHIVDAIAGDQMHDCTVCVDGDLKFYWDIGVTFGFQFRKLKWDWEIVKFGQEQKLMDYYISIPNGFGKGVCPNIYHAVNVQVNKLENGEAEPVKEAVVSASGAKFDTNGDGKWDSVSSVTTDTDGKVTLYFKPGTYSIDVVCNTYSPQKTFVNVLDIETIVAVTLTKGCRTATFMADGAVYSTMKYNKDDVITPPTPTKDGYKFLEWSPAVPAKMPDADTTFTAVFVKNSEGDEDSDGPAIGNLSGYTVGDCLYFGSYPQTRVTDSATLTLLNNAPKTWVSYGYYSGNNNYGSMTSGDYMQYTDITLGNTKYRGVTITRYRPSITYEKNYTTYTSISGAVVSTSQDNNGYYPGRAYWFKYEPILWRVLDPDEGLVLAEMVLDSQPYSNWINSSNREYYNNTECTTYANDYKTSSIRAWLNADFYNTAFNVAEKEKVAKTKLDNYAYSTVVYKYNSETTNDKIFLLSYKDAYNTKYGFLSDTNRMIQGSDYAECQGLDDVNSAYNRYSYSRWWLRSAGCASCYACSIYYDGSFSDHIPVSYTDVGVRPALKLNLDSVTAQSEKEPVVRSAVETTGTRTVQKGQTYTASCGGAVPDAEYVLLVRKSGTSGISADNLWYIDQQTADGTSVTFTYVPSASGTCTVEIFGTFHGEEPPTAPTVTGVTLADTTVQYQKSARLVPQITAENGTEYTITYTSSNPKVAVVDNNGSVTTKGKGTAAITCTAVNDNDPENTVSTTCTVTVKFAWWQWIIWILLFGWIWY